MFARGSGPLDSLLYSRAKRPTYLPGVVYPITKDSPTPKLAAKRSVNFLQIQFTFNSHSLQIHHRFTSDLIYFKSPYAHFIRP
ncbi:hypothetical protein VN97_g4408 [Penicillium thymicola]|uniref:Uncharacterized protein n=1 Tax=Penicillium thymicola TaxID=293382 RepID=A0AAI9X9D7_PENTH|nr:hypothetical protein VN97_g4408 [Penicillium thymicola]